MLQESKRDHRVKDDMGTKLASVSFRSKTQMNYKTCLYCPSANQIPNEPKCCKLCRWHISQLKKLAAVPLFHRKFVGGEYMPPCCCSGQIDAVAGSDRLS